MRKTPANPRSALNLAFRSGLAASDREWRKVQPFKGIGAARTLFVTDDQVRALKCPILLCRIGYRDSQTGKHYVFLTNNFKLAAKTIADIYKARWQVELFFKWVKQNLKIKSFIGTSKNAVMTQAWIALCVSATGIYQVPIDTEDKHSAKIAFVAA